MVLKVMACVAAATLLSGCFAGLAYSGRVGAGALYAETQMPDQGTQAGPGSKTGEACSSSILGLITTGDASVVAAARNGGIRKLATVDNKHKNILGVYATFCTVVTGD